MELTPAEMKDAVMYDLWRVLRLVQHDYSNEIDGETAQLIEALLNKL